MTERRVLVDTGPLVAIFQSREHHHEACVRELRRLVPPLLTTWAVLTEAAWLMRNRPDAVQAMLKRVDEGMLVLPELDKSAPTWIADFLGRYRSLGAQLADASLVYLAEREGIQTIFTLDRRDFTVYRLSRNRSLRLLPENP